MPINKFASLLSLCFLLSISTYAQIFGPKTICPGTSYRYYVESDWALGGSFFAWSVQGGSIQSSSDREAFVVWSSNTGVRKVTIKVTYVNNISAPDEFPIYVYEDVFTDYFIDVKPITQTAQNYSSICQDQSVTLTASGAVAGQSYRWYNSSQVLIPNQTGSQLTVVANSNMTYYSTIVNALGCDASGFTLHNVILFPVLAPGTIGGAISPVCYQTDLQPFTSSLAASGGNGSYSYQWQSRTPGGSWSDISGANNTAYDHGTPLTSTTEFKRVVTSCGQTRESNILTVTVQPQPTVSNAGIDQLNESSCGLTNVVLGANIPTTGRGSWSVIDGMGGAFGNATSPTSTFSGVAGNTYTLRWTIANRPCTSSTDDVIIRFNQLPTVANAGADQAGLPTCGLTSVTLAGNMPVVGSGSWSIISGSGGSFGNSTSANSTFSGVTGNTYTLRWTIANSPCTSSTDDVIIKFNQLPTVANAGPDQTGSTTCGLTSVTLAGNTPSEGTGVWSIISGAGGVLGSASNPNSTFSGVAGTTYTLRWTISNGACTSSTDEVVIKFNGLSIGGTVSANAEAYGTANGALTLSGNNGTVQKWQQKLASADWTDITNNSTILPYTTTNTTRYRAVVKNGVCAIANSTEVEIIVNPLPVLIVNGLTAIAPNSSAQLTTLLPYYSYQWYKNGVIIAGANTQTLTVTQPGLYKVALKANGSSPEYATEEVDIKRTLDAPLQDMNYVRSTTFVVSGVNEATDVYQLNPQDYSISTTYFDGLGRPVQSVALGAAGNGSDLITPVEYDAFGREAKKYLPYAHAERDGRYQPTALTSQGIFYNNANDKVADDIAPYSQTIFEPSPLNRVIKQGAPGLAWQPDPEDKSYNSTDHSVKFSYEFNQANEVRLWKYAYPSAANPLGIVTGTGINTHYGANQLYKNKTKDEQQNEVIEYVDKEGKTILKRVQVVSGNVAVNDTNYASTYYVYDDFGNLVSVIQPEGTKLLASTFKPFTWGSVSGFTVSADNTLTKTIPTGYANSGAYLSSGISSSTNGWVRMVALETNTSRMIGLTPANAGNNNNIAFALELGNDGFVYVWEDGIKKNNLGSYTSGTSVMVSREGGYIKYYVNEIEKLVSEKTTVTSLSTSQLFLDVTINEPGGTIQNVDISFSSEKIILKNYLFQYAYDARKRMIMKQVPGAEPVYMVYDNRDRLVMTQDAKQRSSTGRPWTFTKYDALNRPIATGLKDTTVGVLLTQAQMQALVDNFYTKASSQYYEKFIGTAANNLHGYSNKSFPTTHSAYGTTVGSPNENYFLTVTYYDDYSAITNWGSDYQYSDLNLQATVNGVTYNQPDYPNNRVKGQVTATKIKVLDGGTTGGPTWLKSINYYDDKYRVIQNISDNYKGGVDRLTNIIDFIGKVLLANTEHVTRDIAWQDISNLEFIGNKILSSPTKVNAWGNGGAASTEQLPAGQNGWIEFTVFQGWGNIVLGFSDQNVDNNHNTIDYGIYFGGGSVVRPYENGVAKSHSSYGIKAGDILKIERIGTQIKYYQNGILLYTSTVPSTTSLVADIAIFDKNLAVSNVRTSFSQKVNSIKRRFDYDHAGRLINTWHKFNDQPEILLAHNDYNELGQLIDKKLHVSSPVGGGQEVATQSVDYAYNIRGWLTHINDAALTPQAGENKDYFGMELAYNTDLGTGNPSDKLQFNGNINAMKWSNNQGLSDQKENAYNFTYDPLNRLKTADFKQKDASSWGLAKYRDVNGTLQSVNAFSETITEYDHNGNIKFLQRTGQDGSLIDDLTYNYGANPTTQSNRLLRVNDARNDEQGFIETSNHNIDDYIYDSNGNLIIDRNKGTEEILKNGEFNNGSTDWSLTEPGRLTFADGKVTIAAGSNLAILTQPVPLRPNVRHSVYIVLTRTSATGHVNVRLANNLSGNVTGTTTFSILSSNTDDIKIEIQPGFEGFIEAIEVKAPIAISYNYLNLPEVVSKGDDSMIQYIYTATGQKLAQVVTEGTKTKTTDYVGEYVYQNDTLLFVNHEEGRISLSSASPLSSGEGQGGEATYQYHLKDHLGNVRLTFTTKEETEATLATLETANENEERGNFLKYDDIRKVNSRLFDHTHAPGVGTTHYAIRLSGTAEETYGLARSIAVMPGDVVSAEVFAKYLDKNENNWSEAVSTFIGAISGAQPGSSGTVIDGGNYGSPSAGTIPFPGPIGKSNEPSDVPKAYLNWLVFDKNFSPIANKSGFRPITDDAYENGKLELSEGVYDPEGRAHEALESPLIEITEPGYVYIYLSNEEPGTEVYFDDFKVTHTKSPVVQSDDYYPFGLTFNSYSRENSTPNKFKFQSQEHIDDLDLGWDSFKWRNHMPDIGRFFNVDPIAEDYYYNSPYAFSENKVVAHREIEGLESQSIHVNIEIKKLENVWNTFVSKVETTVKSVVDAITPDKQIGPTDIEKKNNTPIPVNSDQKDRGGDNNSAPNDLDGNTNPQYNPNSPAQGGKGGEKVVTQEGGQTETQNPDKPNDKVQIDSIWTGKGEREYTSSGEVIKGQVIVKGDTQMVVKKIIKYDQKKKQ